MHLPSSKESSASLDVHYQKISLEVYKSKYQLHTKEGVPVDKDINDTFKRVAKALAAVEKDSDKWYTKFLWAMQNGAIPAGRILSNAGAEEFKPRTSLINCTIAGKVLDSIEGILQSVKEAGITLSAGCGIGYHFGTLRPKGAFVGGVGATTSGSLSFMDIFDSMCSTISSAGGRRGAQMGTMDVFHPDIEDFIRAKRQDGRFRQFNLSILITDEFLSAVKRNQPWQLVFPVKRAEYTEKLPVIWKYWSIDDDYIKNEKGEVACKIYKTVKARDLWDLIMRSTYDYAEPGFILVDRINRMNNLWFCEDITTSNPCGEEPMPPHGSCLLGSVNLVKFVEHPFTKSSHFNYEKYRDVVKVFTRLLDNVVELNGLPLEEQKNEIFYKRRHGMGFLGLGSAMSMLGIKYGSSESLEFAEEVAKILALENYSIGLELAKEKGPAPVMEDEFEVTPKMVEQRPEILSDGFKIGDKVKGKVLHSKYGEFMRQLASVNPDLVEDLIEHGCRFSHALAIAPTGTISLSIGSNVSNGLEPSFSLEYNRNLTVQGKKTRQTTKVYAYEWLAYKIFKGLSPEDECSVPEWFATSDSITPKEHIDVLAAVQYWNDSNSSKTINIPSDFPFEDFKDIYMYGAEKGLKSCATFRYNPTTLQGVLVKDSDLKNTKYKFTLETGEVIEVIGDEKVEYGGEVHTAAMLFDAIKEKRFNIGY